MWPQTKHFNLFLSSWWRRSVFLVTGQAMSYFVTLSHWSHLYESWPPCFFFQCSVRELQSGKDCLQTVQTGFIFWCFLRLELFNFKNRHFPWITTFTRWARLWSSTSGSSPSGHSTSESCKLLECQGLVLGICQSFWLWAWPSVLLTGPLESKNIQWILYLYSNHCQYHTINCANHCSYKLPN